MTASVTTILIALLRKHALSNSDRPVTPNLPLGATGLGLDSLALLQFITTVENHFEIELPETIWTDKGELTIETFAFLVVNARPDLRGATVERQIAEVADSKVIAHHDREHHFYDIPRASLIIRAWRKILHIEKYFVISRNLHVDDLPRHTALIPLEISVATADDIERSVSMFPAAVHAAKMAVYRDRIKRNDTALVASVNDAIVGIDWITGTGGYEEDIALSVSLSPGSCLGHDLNEHPDYRGKGVGMALLSQSLIHSCNTGYKRQLTIVHSANTKMLSAAVTIFGFTSIGEITTTRIFHRKSSRWKLGSNHGRDAVVL